MPFNHHRAMNQHNFIFSFCINKFKRDILRCSEVENEPMWLLTLSYLGSCRNLFEKISSQFHDGFWTVTGFYIISKKIDGFILLEKSI